MIVLYYLCLCQNSLICLVCQNLDREVVAELKAAGASWIQFDEPTLVLDLEAHKLEAFTAAYSELESTLSGLNVLIETYFADIPAETFKILTALKGVTAYGVDLVRGKKTLELIKSGFPAGKYLFAGVVDGRNIWANDLAASLSVLQELEGVVGKGTLQMHFGVYSDALPLSFTTVNWKIIFLYFFPCRQACRLHLLLSPPHCC